MIRIAVLGCGRIGAMHAANIAAHSRARLAAVQDINSAAAEAVAASTGARVMRTAADIFSSPDVDAVLIATATDTHADLLEQGGCGWKAGALREADRPQSRPGEPLRGDDPGINDSDPARIRASLRSEPQGRSRRRQVAVTSRDPGLAPEAYLKVSGGIFRDMTIHDFDMARFVLGEEPEVVFATASRLVAPALMEKLGDYDTVTVVLTTASGKQAVITHSREAVYGYDQRVEHSDLRERRCPKTAGRMRCCFRARGSAITRRRSCATLLSATERRSTPKSTPSSKRSNSKGLPSSVSKTGGGLWPSQKPR